jgi:DNA-binding NarL/FixJ family response regulator
MTRIIIVDDESVTGQGIAALLDRTGVEVAGVERTPDTAVTLARRVSPDVIVCDVMFGRHPLGLELPGMLRSAGVDVPVIYLSSWDMPYLVRRAREAGAMGYVSKLAGPARLRSAIEGAATGRAVFPRQDIEERGPSARELDVVRHVAAGLSSPAIANALGLSTRTVEGYLLHLYTRYGIPDRTRLATLALERGWITLGDLEAVEDRGS